MSRYKPVGWRNDNYRHYLAAKYGFARKRSGIVGKVGSTPIIAQKLPKGQAYPLSSEEVAHELRRFPKKDVKGIKAVKFVPPKDHQQEDAWAQAIRSRKQILIFSQPAKDGKLAGKPPEEVRHHMKSYVLPHEVGHLVALKELPTDKKLSTAEARADGYAAGMSVKDRDVRLFEYLHE